jgi:hypothetical protein
LPAAEIATSALKSGIDDITGFDSPCLFRFVGDACNVDDEQGRIKGVIVHIDRRLTSAVADVK